MMEEISNKAIDAEDISFQSVPFARQLALLENNTENIDSFRKHLKGHLLRESAHADFQQQNLQNKHHQYQEEDTSEYDMGTATLISFYTAYMRKKINANHNLLHDQRETVLVPCETTLVTSRSFINPNKASLAAADKSVDIAQGRMEDAKIAAKNARLLCRNARRKLDKLKNEFQRNKNDRHRDSYLSGHVETGELRSLIYEKFGDDAREKISGSRSNEYEHDSAFAAGSQSQLQLQWQSQSSPSVVESYVSEETANASSSVLSSSATPSISSSSVSNSPRAGVGTVAGAETKKMTKKERKLLRAIAHQAGKTASATASTTTSAVTSANSSSNNLAALGSSLDIELDSITGREKSAAAGAQKENTSSVPIPHLTISTAPLLPTSHVTSVGHVNSKVAVRSVAALTHRLAQATALYRELLADCHKRKWDVLAAKINLLETIKQRDDALLLVGSYFSDFEIKRNAMVKENMRAFCKAERESLKEKEQLLSELEASIEGYNPSSDLHNFVKNERDLNRSLRYSQALSLLDWFRQQRIEIRGLEELKTIKAVQEKAQTQQCLPAACVGKREDAKADAYYSEDYDSYDVEAEGQDDDGCDYYDSSACSDAGSAGTAVRFVSETGHNRCDMSASKSQSPALGITVNMIPLNGSPLATNHSPSHGANSTPLRVATQVGLGGGDIDARGDKTNVESKKKGNSNSNNNSNIDSNSNGNGNSQVRHLEDLNSMLLEAVDALFGNLGPSSETSTRSSSPLSHAPPASSSPCTSSASSTTSGNTGADRNGNTNGKGKGKGKSGTAGVVDTSGINDKWELLLQSPDNMHTFLNAMELGCSGGTSAGMSGSGKANSSRNHPAILTHRPTQLSDLQFESVVSALTVLLTSCMFSGDIHMAVRIHDLSSSFYKNMFDNSEQRQGVGSPSMEGSSNYRSLPSRPSFGMSYSGASFASKSELGGYRSDIGPVVVLCSDPRIALHRFWHPGEEYNMNLWFNVTLDKLSAAFEKLYPLTSRTEGNNTNNIFLAEWEHMTPKILFETVQNVHDAVHTTLVQVVPLMKNFQLTQDIAKRIICQLVARFELDEDKEISLLLVIKQVYASNSNHSSSAYPSYTHVAHSHAHAQSTKVMPVQFTSITPVPYTSIENLKRREVRSERER